jgi:hypothetical protein
MNVNITLFEQLKSSLVEIRKFQLFSNWWIERPKHFLQEKIYEIVEIIENLTEAKTNLPIHLREFVEQHHQYEQFIVIQNEKVKLLRQRIEKESQQSKKDFLHSKLTYLCVKINLIYFWFNHKISLAQLKIIF